MATPTIDSGAEEEDDDDASEVDVRSVRTGAAMPCSGIVAETIADPLDMTGLGNKSLGLGDEAAAPLPLTEFADR